MYEKTYPSKRFNITLDFLKKHIKTSETIFDLGVPNPFSKIMADNGYTVFNTKGEGSYCEIVLVNGEKIICSRYLKNFEDILSNYNNFLRVQKSYIANLNYVSVYNKSDGGNLEFNNKTCIPISLDKVDLIMEKITLIKR